MPFLLAVVAPLVRRSTYRRLTFLLLGSAASFGFSSAGTFLTLPLTVVLDELALAVAIIVPVVMLQPVVFAVGLLRPTLVIQRTVARLLLGVAAADDLHPTTALSWRHRWRSALFFVLHVLAGYLFGIVLIGFALVTLTAAEAYLQPVDSALPATASEFRLLKSALVVVSALVVLYLAALLGAGFARLAARLLGATPDERLEALQQRVRHLAEHNRLARELHDSVGHALSVVTVQAAAAQRVLDRDPEVARAALAAVADSARRALADLDHVLALLREEPTPTHPQWTLANLDHLLTDVRTAGLTVDAHCTGDLAAVPAVVSREAYRIVQEGLTNVLRHAGQVSVTLRIASDHAGLTVELSNAMLPVPAIEPPESGGRGLVGIRERVTLLGGTVTAGPLDGRWTLLVHVPPAPVTAPPQPQQTPAPTAAPA